MSASDEPQWAVLTPADGWTPAFPGQRPPFNGPAGNALGLHHGAHSPRRVDPIAQEFVDVVLADPAVSWLTDADRPALFALGRAEAKVQLLEDYLHRLAEAEGAELADLEAKRVEAAYRELHRAETRAASLRSQLGFTPLSRARLGRDTAAAKVDLSKLLSQARETAERGGESQ